MNKLLLGFLILSAGAISFGGLHRVGAQAGVSNALRRQEWAMATNRLAALDLAAAALREEVEGKKDRVRQQAAAPPNLSPGVAELLQGRTATGHAAALTELREQLGIGWDTSGDYVLVSKRVLKALNLHPFTETARAVLAISPDEEAELHAARRRVQEVTLCRVQRLEPAGDIVAQYLVQTDPAVERSLSNHFSAAIQAALGPERTDLVLARAWTELRRELAPVGQEPVSLVIRRSVAEGEPKLFWEVRQGKSVVSSKEVRYAHYPSPWFLRLFPGGWEPLAQREGFELPKTFKRPQPDH